MYCENCGNEAEGIMIKSDYGYKDRDMFVSECCQADLYEDKALKELSIVPDHLSEYSDNNY